MDNKQKIADLLNLEEIVKIMNLLGQTEEIGHTGLPIPMRDGYYGISFSTHNYSESTMTILDIKPAGPTCYDRALSIICNYEYTGHERMGDTVDVSIRYSLNDKETLALSCHEYVQRNNNTFSVLKDVTLDKIMEDYGFTYWGDSIQVLDWNLKPERNSSGKLINQDESLSDEKLRKKIRSSLEKKAFNKNELINFTNHMKMIVDSLIQQKEDEHIRQYVKSLSPREFEVLKSEVNKRG